MLFFSQFIFVTKFSKLIPLSKSNKSNFQHASVKIEFKFSLHNFLHRIKPFLISNFLILSLAVLHTSYLHDSLINRKTFALFTDFDLSLIQLNNVQWYLFWYEEKKHYQSFFYGKWVKTFNFLFFLKEIFAWHGLEKVRTKASIRWWMKSRLRDSIERNKRSKSCNFIDEWA